MFAQFPHKSVLALLCCSAFVIGIGLGTGLEMRQEIFFMLLLVGLFFAVVSKKTFVRVSGILLVFMAVGFIRTTLLPSYDNNPYDQWVEFEAVVAREPELMIDHQRLVAESEGISGLVQLKLPLQPRISLGDRLEISCTLRRPEPFDGFRYDRYLERYQVSALCYYPSFHIIGQEESLKRKIFSIKKKLTTNVQHALAPPEHTIILGALFGLKRGIPQEIMDNFRATGTSHLLVISGLHVALLTSIILVILKQLHLPRRTLVCLVIAFLVFYLVLTGWQPSATRASLFGSTVLVAELLGRRNSSLRLLVFAAALMLAINPLLLLFDAGFQLSFLATGGIITFNKWIEERSTFIPTLLGLRTVFATSMAAIFSTTPIIAYSFHNFSPVALVANLILVPLMPLVMLGSVVITVLSALSQQLASWLALPLYYLIHLMLDLVGWFAALPNASIKIPNFSTALLFILLGVISVCAFRVLTSRE